jgi:hypothetical protein
MKTTTKARKPVLDRNSEGNGSSQSTKARLAEAMPFDAGVTTKDSQYLRRIVDAIQGDKKHPRHHGIAMQAHHVLSATGMHRSRLAEKIRKFGYNINLLENLVFLPCTLQGACYLGVQPHRGNHTAPSDPDSYKNDVQPMDYHDLIAERIRNLELGLTRECPGFIGGEKELEARAKVRRDLDMLSAKIVRLIQYSPRQAPLTSVAAHFQPGNAVGCAGTDSTTTHSPSTHCAVERNHHGRQGPWQKFENITFESDGRYILQLKR